MNEKTIKFTVTKQYLKDNPQLAETLKVGQVIDVPNPDYKEQEKEQEGKGIKPADDQKEIEGALLNGNTAETLTDPLAGKTIELAGTNNPNDNLAQSRQVTGVIEEAETDQYDLPAIPAEKVAKGPVKMKHLAKRGLHLTKAQATALLPHISYISQHGSQEGEVILLDEDKIGG